MNNLPYNNEKEEQQKEYKNMKSIIEEFKAVANKKIILWMNYCIQHANY